MHRLTVLGRSLASGLCQTGVKSTTPITGTVQTTQTRGNAGGPPGKLECFVDGKKVLVDPGTTVLQVRFRWKTYRISDLLHYLCLVSQSHVREMLLCSHTF